ncbi:MAG: hypothetical protein RRY29_03180, partial [Desulfovibrionaceae bacterium]
PQKSFIFSRKTRHDTEATAFAAALKICMPPQIFKIIRHTSLANVGIYPYTTRLHRFLLNKHKTP